MRKKQTQDLDVGKIMKDINQMKIVCVIQARTGSTRLPNKVLKKIEEKETVILQRRCLRAAKDIAKCSTITEDMIDVLRPLAKDALVPKYKEIVMGQEVKVDMKKGDPFTWAKI
jgi:N-acetylneuraminate synthase